MKINLGAFFYVQNLQPTVKANSPNKFDELLIVSCCDAGGENRICKERSDGIGIDTQSIPSRHFTLLFA